MHKIVEVILSTLCELDQQGVVQLGGIEVDSQAPLFGELGRLDAVSSVSLSVAVEQALEDKLNLTVKSGRRALCPSAPARTAR